LKHNFYVLCIITIKVYDILRENTWIKLPKNFDCSEIVVTVLLYYRNYVFSFLVVVREGDRGGETFSGGILSIVKIDTLFTKNPEKLND